MSEQRITVGGLEYSKRSDWMNYFFTTSDSDTDADNIIMCTQLFQNNIFNKCQQEYLAAHPENRIYKSIIVENATDVDGMIKYITTMRPQFNLPERIKKPDNSDRVAVEKYLEYVNELYNSVINVTIEPEPVKKESTVIDILRSNEATAANIETPDTAATSRGILKRFEFTEHTAEQIKQNYAEIYNKKIKHIHGHFTNFSIGENGELIIKPTETKQIARSTNIVYISQHINTSIIFSADTVRIINNLDFSGVICEVINDDLICAFQVDDSVLDQCSKEKTLKYSSWLVKNIGADGTISLNNIVKYYKENFGITVNVYSANKNNIITMVNATKYIQKAYAGIIDSTYRVIDNKAFNDLDWEDYDKKIHPLILKSKFEHAFHAHIENNRMIISYIDEIHGGLDSIVTIPLNFINGHTHPFSRYQGFDLEMPSIPDFDYFMHSCVEFKFMAMTLICSPEGVYAFTAKVDMLNNYIYPNFMDSCMDITKITEHISRHVNTAVQYTRTTFKDCIDSLIREYDKMGISLLFRPTPGINLNKRTHRSATVFSLPQELFDKQVAIIPKVDANFIINADFEEIDEFDRGKAGIADENAIIVGLLYNGKKILFAPYGMREVSITLTEPERDFQKKYLLNINQMQSFAVVSIAILFTDEFFPFVFDIKLIKIIASYILVGREKICIIMSESYITIYDFVKNELRGPLNRNTKKYITHNGRN